VLGPSRRSEKGGSALMKDDLDTGYVRAGVDSGAIAPEAGTERHCVVCGETANVWLVVSPACVNHRMPRSLEAALAAARLAGRNQWVVAHGDNCCWEDECKRPGRECQWPMPAALEPRRG
jgi:hypothetical protein